MARSRRNSGSQRFGQARRARELRRGMEHLEARMLLAGELFTSKQVEGLLGSMTPTHYYQAGDEKIELAIHPDRVAVRFNDTGESTSLVGGANLLRKVDGDVEILGLQGIGTEGSREGLASSSEVADVYPVFVNFKTGTEMVVTDEVIVSLQSGVSAEAFFQQNPSFASYRRLMGTPDQFVATIANGGGEAALQVALDVANDSRVNWASPNFYQNWQKYFTPNDPRFGNQWHMENTGQGGGLVDADSDLPAAWDIQAGGASNIVIGIVDDGVDGHQDLNLWVNPGEIAGNSVDDDGNGWVDDINGWNFVSNNNLSQYTEPEDFHGVSVAGVAAAIGNNGEGVAGAAYGSAVMSARVFEGIFVGSDADFAAAIYYTAGRTADGLGLWGASTVVNHSWGGGADASVINDAYAWATANGNFGAGVTSFVASGNDFDSFVSYPSYLSATNPGLLSIGATNNLGTRSDYSNYGVDLDFVTPSSDTRSGYLAIDTTDRVGIDGLAAGDYTGTGASGFGGTSSATPLATGIGALVLAQAQDQSISLTPAQLKGHLKNNTEMIGGQTYSLTTGKTAQYGTGRLNAGWAVANVGKAEISATSSTAELVDGVSSFAFGTLFIGESTDISFRIRNQGTSPLNLPSITSSNPNFTIVGFTPATLLVGQSTTITMRFSPIAEGSLTGTISIASNDLDEGSFDIGVSGVGVAIDISGTIYEDFNGDGVKSGFEPGTNGQVLFLDANNNGVIDTIGTTNVSIAPNLSLPDEATTISTLNTSGIAGTVQDVNVTINLTHTYDADLIITLIAPNGAQSILASGNGGSGENFTNTVFDDSAATSISAGTAPFTGSFRPVTPLLNLLGSDPNGSWQLRIVDTAGGDSGTLLNWSLAITTSETSALTDSAGGYKFISVPDGTHTLRAMVPSGWIGTSPVTQNITISGPEDHFSGVDFGRAKNNRVYGYLYHDYNRDGDIDPVEPGIGGRQVLVDTNENGLLDSSTTNLVNGTDVDILDADVITSSVVASGLAGVVNDVNIRIRLTHTWNSDLDVFLIAPDGTRVELFTDVGGSSDNFTNTVLDDEAGGLISDASGPFTGTFRPEGSLAILDGMSPNGTWTLEVTDDTDDDDGILDEWEIIMSHGEVTFTSSANGNLLLDMPTGSYDLVALPASGWGFTNPLDGKHSVTVAGAPVFSTFYGLLQDSNRVVSVSSATIPENAGANATIGSLAVTPSGGFTYDYTFVAGTGDTDNASFVIDSGVLKLIANPDFETKSSYSVRLRATNTTLGSYDEQVLTINVADQPEGTALKDVFVATWTPGGIDVTLSSNNAAPISLGTFPLSQPLKFYGMGNTDTLRLLGGVGADTLLVDGTGMYINSMLVETDSIESRTIGGGAGNDTFWFDADSPLGTYTVDESGGGIDTLNFLLTSSSGVSVNLALSTIQAINANLSLILTTATTRFENVVGTALNDTLTGNSLANRFDSGLGDDVMVGGAGNDVYLFHSDSTIGVDTITDVSGIDTLDFSSASSVGIAIDLLVTTAQVLNANHTLTLGTSIIEGVVGTGAADIITGNNAANFLTGGGGDDALAGGSGNDTYLFNADNSLGTDTITDSVGIDTLDFSSTPTMGVTVNLLNAGLQAANANLSLVLATATLLDNLVGSQGNDLLAGNGNINRLTGSGGDDVLDGAAGNDVYWFNTAAPSGVDTINDSAGTADLLDFSTSVSGINIDMDAVGVTTVNANLGLFFTANNQIEKVTGSAFNDTITGNILNNTILGGAGNDTLNGGAGNDIYVYDTDVIQHGIDTLLDSAGVDLLDFSLTTTRQIALNLGVTGDQVVNSNLTVNFVSTVDFENVYGGALVDTLTGNDNANLMSGRGGNDILDGGQGNDVFQFDADVVLGNDTVIDGSGLDTIDFTGTTTGGITIDLSMTSLQVVRSGNLGLTLSVGTDIERVIGSTQADTITGNSVGNILMGGLGNDILDGGLGADILIGGTGGDTLIGGDGSDLILAGTTTYDLNPAALWQIYGEWTGANDFATRVNNLRTGFGGLPTLVKNVSVKKDTGSNTLTGGNNEDWFFANVVGGTDVTDLALGDILDDF